MVGIIICLSLLSCVHSYPNHGTFRTFENDSIRHRYQACIRGIALYQIRHHPNLFSDDSLDAERMRTNICVELIQREIEFSKEGESDI